MWIKIKEEDGKGLGENIISIPSVNYRQDYMKYSQVKRKYIFSIWQALSKKHLESSFEVVDNIFYRYDLISNRVLRI